jgi:hypothetical protein
MSIFGKLDAENISTNPFKIDQGEYSAEVTKAYYKPNRNDVRQLLIEYTINDPESEFLDSKATKFFDLPDENLDEEALELLPPEEKRKIRRNLSSLKIALCGRDGYANQPGLGVSPDDLNDESWTPETLVGRKVTLAISNYGANNEGVNVRWANVITE